MSYPTDGHNRTCRQEVHDINMHHFVSLITMPFHISIIHILNTNQLLSRGHYSYCKSTENTDDSPIGIIGPIDIGTGGIPGIIGIGTNPGGGIPADVVDA